GFCKFLPDLSHDRKTSLKGTNILRKASSHNHIRRKLIKVYLSVNTPGAVRNSFAGDQLGMILWEK
ncbi:MAG: hypothetical protein KDH84_00110, partial [Calditrichaeota bacterium]|nr:hypothetical protein [Calditrichota bacterium]